MIISQLRFCSIAALAIGSLAASLGACGDDGGGADVPPEPDARADDTDAPDGGSAPATSYTCEPRSGDRLRLSVRHHEDGSQEAVRLFDDELGVWCSFRDGGDGVTRCLPEPDGSQVVAARAVYTDASCEVPLLELNSRDVNPTAVHRFAALTPSPAVPECGPRLRYVEAGGFVDPSSYAELYVRSEIGCVAEPVDVIRHRWHEMGAPVELDRFAAATARWTEGGRLAVEVLEGEDGSRWCAEDVFRDREMGDHPCTPVQDETGELRCMPRAPEAIVSATARSSCGDMAVLSQVPGSCDEGLDYVRKPAMDGCFSRKTVFERGAEVTGPLYYRPGPSACIPLSDEYRYHRIGDRVTADRMPALTESARPGRRLERLEIAGDGVRMPRPIWRDTELDVTCQFTTAVDGSSRCLPGLTSGERVRPDPAYPASTQAALTSLFVGDCDQPSEGFLVFENGACDPDARPRYGTQQTLTGTTVWRVGERVEGVRFLNIYCEPLPASVQVYRPGEQVDPSAFVLGTESFE